MFLCLKMIPFLDFQMTQHAMIMICLKMDLSKMVLAEITMSRGCGARFSWIEMEFQHAVLKGHSKKEMETCFLRSYCATHSYSHLDACFSFLASSRCSVCLLKEAKRKTCVSQDCKRTRAKKTKVRLFGFLGAEHRPF